ncbi:MAG: sigma-54 dependent transcriptional regulator [Oleiphilaceae bacterium]|nr:sigma-54 dependent transcriptional regulator [Oleiphilaceae bacterium]
MANSTILIVEDDRELREALCTTLQLAGMDYIEADCAEAALLQLDKRTVDLVVSDVNMPGMDGHELLKQVKARAPGLPMMLITAFGQIKHAVDAMQQGAADYLVKPFEPKVLIQSIVKILGQSGSEVQSDAPVAEDPFTKQFFQVAKRVAESESTVMISGESGTGKEVLARYIHDHSPRKNKPFVAINCAAIPENMLEAMLFGHEKGAFTGAIASSPGKFEQANGGTLLLDEISEMEIGLQAKLLRVLQEREVERVGGRKAIPLDVRVLATTNRDLKEYVQEGKFREDLYYRLSVFPMMWKPLRERPMDIWPLAQRLLQVHAIKMKREGLQFDEDVQRVLTQYHWPGNVRELDNAVQRALILATGQRVSASDFCLDTSDSGDWMMQAGFTQPQAVERDLATSVEEEDRSALGKDLKLREYQIIIDTLKQENGRKKQAAERLGISPRTLRYKLAQMRESGIDVAAELAA